MLLIGALALSGGSLAFLLGARASHTLGRVVTHGEVQPASNVAQVGAIKN
jgi:hypothetical protein